MKPLPPNLQSILQGAKDAAFKRSPLDCIASECPGCSTCNPHREAPVPKGDPVQSESSEKSGSSRGSVRTYYVAWFKNRKGIPVKEARQRPQRIWPECLKIRAKNKAEANQIARERGLL
jgi:hypothetical protein